MEAKTLILKWVDAFNEGDAEILSQMYSIDMVNHKITQEPICGNASIKAMLIEHLPKQT